MSEREPTLAAQAGNLQITAFLRELLGARPAPDLVERVLARAAREPAPRAVHARRFGLAAAVLLAGVAVVAAIAWQQHQPSSRQAAPPDIDKQDPPPPSQDKSTPHSIFTKEEQARIDAAIGALASEDLRAAARASIASIKTFFDLDAAIAREVPHGRAEILAVLRAVRWRIAFFSAKSTPGIVGEPLTLIADYSDNTILMVNGKGQTVWQLDDVFGVWDAELTAGGAMLITEFSVSRVREIDSRGKEVWAFEDLKNPYDADRLTNGNTLIADTFGGRVIEVDRAGKVVWEFKDDVRPFDCDRLDNGNTLIADVLHERVIEVDHAGVIVWKHEGVRLVHDADRLANGNTLITLREKKEVIEVDRDGRVVFTLQNLSHPSDADRLPNGNTLVAENGMVREFNAAGKEVWRHEVTWAVEAQRY